MRTRHESWCTSEMAAGSRSGPVLAEATPRRPAASPAGVPTARTRQLTPASVRHHFDGDELTNRRELIVGGGSDHDDEEAVGVPQHEFDRAPRVAPYGI